MLAYLFDAIIHSLFVITLILVVWLVCDCGWLVLRIGGFGCLRAWWLLMIASAFVLLLGFD